MSLSIFVGKNVTHHTPAPIDYFRGLMKYVNKKLQELIIVVKLPSKENLAHDVRGCVVEHQVGIHRITWKNNRINSSLVNHRLFLFIMCYEKTRWDVDFWVPGTYRHSAPTALWCGVSLPESFAPLSASPDQSFSGSSDQSVVALSRQGYNQPALFLEYELCAKWSN